MHKSRFQSSRLRLNFLRSFLSKLMKFVSRINIEGGKCTQHKVIIYHIFVSRQTLKTEQI